MKAGVFLCAVALILTGSAHAAWLGFGPSEAEKIKSEIDRAGREFADCTAAYLQEPALTPIAQKLPKDLSSASLRQLTDDAKPSDAEVTALYVLYDKRQVCRNRAIDQIKSVAPTIAMILADEFTKADKQMVALVQKKISWGEYITAARDLSVDAQKAIAAEDQRIAAGLKKDQEAERARWDQALSAAMQYQQNQQMIDALGSHSSSSTGTVNCKTVGLGGGARQTQCY